MNKHTIHCIICGDYARFVAYAKLSKCSKDTALRDIQQLKTRGILIQNPGGGRSTSYQLTNSLSSVLY